MKVLHLIATPRAQQSNTLVVSNAYLESLQASHPGVEIETLNLFEEDLPAAAGANIESKYKLLMRQQVDPAHQSEWSEVERLIQQFLAADLILVSAPMWNFTIPYVLKYYIDTIVQPGYLFMYNEQGIPVGLVEGKSMVCVTARGADYSPQSPFNAYDFQESYMRAIFGFIGIGDISFIHFQPTDMGPEMREAALKKAMTEARSLGAAVAGSPA